MDLDIHVPKPSYLGRARATRKDLPMSPTSPLRDSLALLADLRKEMEDLLPTVNWTTRCHADSEVLAFMQLVIGNVAAIEVLAKADVRLVVAGTAAAWAAYEEVVTAAWMVLAVSGMKPEAAY